MNEFKVGIMSLLSMVAVVVMSLMVTSNQSGFGSYVSYRTIITDASGIFPKTPIRVAGINAGRIKKIELQGNKALITFEVLERVKVTKNSLLKIKAVGFLGDKYLEIYIGNSQERLIENSFLESKEGGGMEALVKDASEIMKDVKVMMKSMKETFVPVGEEPPMKIIMADMKELLYNTKVVTVSLKNLITDNEDRFNNMLTNLSSFTEELAYHMDRNEPDSAMSDIKEILAKADSMMEDLSKIASNIRDGKGTIGKFLSDDEIADEVRETLAGVRKIVSRADSIRTELDIYSGVNTTSGIAETVVGMTIFPSPERFYLLGVATSELGLQRNRETKTTIDGGAEVTKLEKFRYKNTYRFNAQIGRKIQKWTFRGGIIESTGGFGLDYTWYNFGTTLSAEVFDYRRVTGANVRISTDIQLWNVFYGKFQAEDISNNVNYIFSAGFKFNDEDLKGLIGLFL